MRAEKLNPDILDQAIEWAVRLGSGATKTEDKTAFETWRAADANHERAWREVKAVERTFNELPASSERLAYRTLQATQHAKPRSRGIKLAVSAFLAVAAAFLAIQLPWAERQTHATVAGQRQQIFLNDGTRLHMNVGTEVEVVYTPLSRTIVLRRGEIYIETGRDEGSLLGRRPFRVHAAQVELEALGTKFDARQSGDKTHIHVDEGAVAINIDGVRAAIVRAGERYVVGSSHSAAIRVIDPAFDPTGWTDGVIVAKGMRLDAFAAELSRYTDSPVHCAEEIAQLRVSGVFQLDGADPASQILDALMRTLPVKVQRNAAGLILVKG